MVRQVPGLDTTTLATRAWKQRMMVAERNSPKCQLIGSGEKKHEGEKTREYKMLFYSGMLWSPRFLCWR